MTTTDAQMQDFAQRLLAPANEPEADTPEVEQTDETEIVSEDIDQSEGDEEAVDVAADGDAREEHDDDADTEDDAGQKEPETFTVKVDGRDVQVTLEDLKRGYSGQAYIAKGMQEAAAARKEAEALSQTLQRERDQFLQTIEQISQRGFMQPPTAPDVALIDKDPIAYQKARAKYDIAMQEYQQQQQAIQYQRQQQQAAQQRQMQELVQGQMQALMQAIPEFGDPEKRPKLVGELTKVGVSTYGFSQQEMENITDARAVQVLHDAMKWRQLQAGKANAVKKPLPKAVKPAAKRQQPQGLERERQLEKARKTGRVEDFAAALLQRK